MIPGGKGVIGRGKGEVGRGKGEVLVNGLLYNLGRVTTYAAFGLVFGLVGRSFAWQQKISVILGVLILLGLIVPKFFPALATVPGPVNGLMAKLRKGMSNMLFNGRPASLYGFGLMNGLLPCGMVYMALAGAIASGTAAGGAGFMALFGLGTLPAMWSVTLFGSFLKQGFRAQARRIFPAVMAVMAVLLILRGLNLDIPYVSPALHLSHSQAIECHD
jgi:sulfite exporter TauE/SafE